MKNVTSVPALRADNVGKAQKPKKQGGMFEPSDDSSEEGGFASKGSKNPQVYSKKPTLLMAESEDEDDDFIPATKPSLIQKPTTAAPKANDDSDDLFPATKKPAAKKQ